ncbi:MAG: MFS transporter [Verrucomicrobiota bacterium]
MMVYIGFVLILTQGGIVRRIAPKLGEKRTAFIGLLFVSIGLAVLAPASTVTMLYVGLGIMALGSGLCSPTLTALVSLYSDKKDQGKALGAFRSIGSLGRAIAPIIAGYVFWRLGSDILYWAGAIIVFASSILALQLPKSVSPQK